MLILPLVPLVAEPVRITREPLLPLIDSPVRSAIDPLTPPAFEFEVRSENIPEDVRTPDPLARETAPPVSDSLVPLVTTTRPPAP